MDGTTPLIRRRIPGLLAVLAVMFAAVTWRLVDVQALSADRYAELGKDQRVRRVALAAERGTIFDRDGVELALSVPQQTVWADPRLVTDPPAYARALAPVIGVDEVTILQRLTKPGAAFVYLARKVDDAVADQVKALNLRGVQFVPESERQYPAGALAAPVLGMVGIDNDGLGGLELQYEDVLAGTPGELVVERDPQGRDIPQGTRQFRRAVPGRDLVVTIDQALQFEAEKALVEEVVKSNAKGGMAVVMDVVTGDILAMVNVHGAVDDTPPGPDGPTGRNRAITDVYEPGSTNKVITVASALEHGLVGPSTVLAVPDSLQVADHLFRDHDPHPVMQWSVTDILSNSSNTGTIMIGKMVGKERLDASLRAFGFGDETGLDFPGESGGLILDPTDWYPTSMGTVPIGNGLAVTALQMLNVYTTIANGGEWRAPRLVAGTVDEEGVRHDAPLGETRRVISARTANQLNEMLQRVVLDGTGENAQIPGYLVAGKTGTARKPLEGVRGYSDRYVASFVGFAPAEAPRLAAIVVLDEPFPIYGGIVAAPVFARIMGDALRLTGVPPSAPPDAGSTPLPPPPPAVLTGGGDEVALGSLSPS